MPLRERERDRERENVCGTDFVELLIKLDRIRSRHSEKPLQINWAFSRYEQISMKELS